MISVIIPVYNSAKWIKRCVDSVVNQTFTDLEILLVNDGSTDESGDICDEYASYDSRVRVIHQKNGGVSEARNTGLRNVTGEYVSFIDNDDWIHPRYFEYLYNAINSGTYSLAMVLYKTVKDISGTVSNVEYTTDTVCSFSLRTMLFDSVEESGIPYVFVWAKLYKRELLDDLFFKEVIGEDFEFSFHVNSKVRDAVLVKCCLYHWFQHSESQFRNQTPERINSSIDCYFNILNEIPDKESQIRGLCLKRLWLIMLSTRYVTDISNEYSVVQSDVGRNIEHVAKITVSELMHNKYIPLTYKAMLLVFYYIPLLYCFFRWTMELRYKLKNLY